MALLVQKFGGTSVADVERIQAVARRIAHSREEGHELVIVVSAMGHTTDQLTGLARAISSNPPQREMDMLLATGEQVSIALLSMALHAEGVLTERRRTGDSGHELLRRAEVVPHASRSQNRSVPAHLSVQRLRGASASQC